MILFIITPPNLPSQITFSHTITRCDMRKQTVTIKFVVLTTNNQWAVNDRNDDELLVYVDFDETSNRDVSIKNMFCLVSPIST